MAQTLRAGIEALAEALATDRMAEERTEALAEAAARTWANTTTITTQPFPYMFTPDTTAQGTGRRPVRDIDDYPGHLAIPVDVPVGPMVNPTVDPMPVNPYSSILSAIAYLLFKKEIISAGDYQLMSEVQGHDFYEVISRIIQIADGGVTVTTPDINVVGDYRFYGTAELDDAQAVPVTII